MADHTEKRLTEMAERIAGRLAEKRLAVEGPKGLIPLDVNGKAVVSIELEKEKERQRYHVILTYSKMLWSSGRSH